MDHSENQAHEQHNDHNARNGRCLLDNRPHRSEHTHIHVHCPLCMALCTTPILPVGCVVLSSIPTCILLPCHIRPHSVLFRYACVSGTVSYRSTARTYSYDRRTSGSRSSCRGRHDPFLTRVRTFMRSSSIFFGDKSEFLMTILTPTRRCNEW